MTHEDPIDRIRRFDRRLRENTSVRTEPFAWGTAYFHPGFPLVWDLNYLDVQRTAPPFTADDLIAEADRLQGSAGLQHRRILLDHLDDAERVAPRFRELGWMVNRFVFMELSADPGPPRTGRARELDRDIHRRTYVRTSSEAPYGSEPEVVRQLAGHTDLIAERTDVRYFGAVDGDGTVASICVLFSDGHTAQIEDVATLKAYRRRGLADDLMRFVIAAATESGHDLIFLVADAEDWPRTFYSRLGFRAIALSHDFVLPGDVVYSNG